MTLIPQAKSNVIPTILVAFAAPMASVLGLYFGKQVIRKIEEAQENDDDEIEEVSIIDMVSDIVTDSCDEHVRKIKTIVDTEYNKRELANDQCEDKEPEAPTQ